MTKEPNHPAPTVTAAPKPETAGVWDVTLRNVTKRFGERLVLDQVSLTIPRGETVALIGPSGGGKSTLLRCLNALTPFDAGEVRVGRHTLGPGTRGNGG